MRMIQAAGDIKPNPRTERLLRQRLSRSLKCRRIALDLAAKLGRLRDRLRTLENQLRPARAAVAEALQNWISGQPKFTPLDAIREFSASEQQRLADEKSGTREQPPGPVPGPSALDRQNMPYNDSDGRAFIQTDTHRSSTRGFSGKRQGPPSAAASDAPGRKRRERSAERQVTWKRDPYLATALRPRRTSVIPKYTNGSRGRCESSPSRIASWNGYA